MAFLFSEIERLSMKHEIDFNTKNKVRIHGNMSEKGADRFGTMLGVSALIASSAILIVPIAVSLIVKLL